MTDTPGSQCSATPDEPTRPQTLRNGERAPLEPSLQVLTVRVPAVHPDHYELEFFEDDDGSEQCRRFLEELPTAKRVALEEALAHILGRHGTDVCASEYGRALGRGLFEFRLRHNEAEVIRSYNPDLAERLLSLGQLDQSSNILLRLFFHPYGDRVLLLLGGYDKGRDNSKRRQDREIKLARKLLRQFQARNGTQSVGRRTMAVSVRGVDRARSFVTYYRERRRRS